MGACRRSHPNWHAGAAATAAAIVVNDRLAQRLSQRLSQRLALYMRVGERSLRLFCFTLPLLAPLPHLFLDGTRRLQLVHALSFAPRELLGHLMREAISGNEL